MGSIFFQHQFVSSPLAPSRALWISPVRSNEALAGLRSALFFASRPLRLHLVVDRLGEQDVRFGERLGVQRWGLVVLWLLSGMSPFPEDPNSLGI